MFGNTTEKRIAREADKISSMKEELDAISWGRVLEIGKQLQLRGDIALDIEIGSELVAIAQTNISLAMRLGINPDPIGSRMMASGVEMLEGGFAEAAFDAEAKANPSPVSPSTEVQVSCGLGETEEEDSSFDPQEPVGTTHQLSKTELPIALPSLGFGGRQKQSSVACEKVTAPAATEPAASKQLVDQVAYGVASLPQKAVDPRGNTHTAVQPQTQDAMKPVASQQDAAPAGVLTPPAASLPVGKKHVSSFHNLYESRDGSLCVFEDESGHLVAVDASKLA